MRGFIKKKTEIDFCNSAICNKCGKKFEYDEGLCGWQNLVHKFVIKFAYGSKYDYERWDFDLCEDCIEEIVSTFKIPVEVNEHNDC